MRNSSTYSLFYGIAFRFRNLGPGLPGSKPRMAFRLWGAQWPGRATWAPPGARAAGASGTAAAAWPAATPLAGAPRTRPPRGATSMCQCHAPLNRTQTLTKTRLARLGDTLGPDIPLSRVPTNEVESFG